MRGRLWPSTTPLSWPNFNPRPHAGATWAKAREIADELFQSTPPCGGDKEVPTAYVENLNFNPRPHAGATLITWNVNGLRDFNPRPHAGATVRRGRQIPSDVPVFFSRRSVFRFSKPRYPVLFLSVCFPFALTAPWGLQGRKSFWLPSAGFCSDTYCPGCRTAGCRGLCR